MSSVGIPQVHADDKSVEIEDRSGIEKAIKGILHLITAAVAWFLTYGLDASAVLIDPELFKGIFVGMDTGLYNIWTFVRDIFNVFFIFVLLFSAFATIFQVQKYHLLKSNVLIMIIIMALLVNFSWPITRVIIDAGNITMYYLLDNFIDSNGPKNQKLFGMFGDKSTIMQELAPEYSSSAYKDQSVADAFFSLIMVFAFACAFIVYAILFLIRISAFVLLLVVSPIGFAAAIFPGTRRFADMWWDTLLKWTFVGPLLLFMIFVAAKFLTLMNDILKNIHGKGVSSNPTVHKAILYGVALLIIFTGITASQRIGGSVAQSAIGGARNFGRRIGRKAALGTGAVVGGGLIGAAKYADSKVGNPLARLDGRIRGYKKRLWDNENRSQEKWRLAKEEASAKRREKLGEDNAIEKHKKDTIKAYRERTKNQSVEDLNKVIDNPKNNKYYKQAAVEEIASRKDSIKTAGDLTKNMKVMGNNFKESLELIQNAASDKAIEGTGQDFRNLIEAIETKTGLSTKEKDKLKTAVKERYISEGNANAIYEGNKIFSESERIASNQALLDTIVPASFSFTDPKNKNNTLNLKTEVLKDVDFNTNVHTFARSLERALKSKNISATDKTNFVNNLNKEHRDRLAIRDRNAIKNTFTENTSLKEMASQQDLIKEMPNNPLIKNVYKKLAMNPKIKTELIKDASMESRQILRNEGIV